MKRVWQFPRRKLPYASGPADRPCYDGTMLELMGKTIADQGLATAQTPVLLMVSGGSDSTALAYLAADLRASGELGPLAMLHVNHCLRGAASDGDEAFVRSLAELLAIPLACVRIDVAAQAAKTGENLEAAARHARYAAADCELDALCARVGVPPAEGRIFVAHTFDDRIENFYMRSIVGTGPGGFRSMRYLSGRVARPLLEAEREGLRDYLRKRADAGHPAVRDEAGALWRTDATNERDDRFRTWVRHRMVPLARERNPRLSATMTRTMNLIAEEDDMMEALVDGLERRFVERIPGGFSLACELAGEPRPLQRRLAVRLCKRLLGAEERIDTVTVDAVLAAFADGRPSSGYRANIQGNLEVSAGKRGVALETMAAYRARLGRG